MWLTRIWLSTWLWQYCYQCDCEKCYACHIVIILLNCEKMMFTSYCDYCTVISVIVRRYCVHVFPIDGPCWLWQMMHPGTRPSCWFLSGEGSSPLLAESKPRIWGRRSAPSTQGGKVRKVWLTILSFLCSVGYKLCVTGNSFFFLVVQCGL
jgi:hypothetical protein